MEISRRRFFKLAGAAGAALALPGAVGVGAGIKALVEDERGAWTFADGTYLPKAEFPDLYEVIGVFSGRLDNGPSPYGETDELFRLPLLPRMPGFGWLIKVRPNEDNVPVGCLVAYTGQELPD